MGDVVQVEIPTKAKLLEQLVSAGPFGVLVSLLAMLAYNFERVPESVLIDALEKAPWLIVVLVLVWLLVWLVNNHKERETDLIKALEHNADENRIIISANTISNANVVGVMTELRTDLRDHRKEVELMRGEISDLSKGMSNAG